MTKKSKNTYILAINCSPRDKSNSRALLEHTLDHCTKTFPDTFSGDIINLKDHRIEPCQACDVCGKDPKTDAFMPCIIDDDMKEIGEKMARADGFLIATPVYFGLPTDLFSKFIMRTRFLRHQDFKLADKAVAIMAIAGRRSGGAETTITASWLPFIRHGCLIVGNGDKTCQFGTVGWAGSRGHILSDDWGLEQARDTAVRVYQTARIIKAGKESLGYENYMRFSYGSGARDS